MTIENCTDTDEQPSTYKALLAFLEEWPLYPTDGKGMIIEGRKAAAEFLSEDEVQGILRFQDMNVRALKQQVEQLRAASTEHVWQR